jgi:hypothetical protein
MARGARVNVPWFTHHSSRTALSAPGPVKWSESIRSFTRGSQGVQQRNFAVSVVQPGDKVAIEIEFNEKVHGLSGDTVWLSLEDDTSLEDAEALRALLERIGHRITVTNVRS